MLKKALTQKCWHSQKHKDLFFPPN